ncbi:DUF4145 domain-containing protein [Novosphingobium guangzhouense]|uniref:DUF4145 domain-containing protein n=1 Tax=Novosphingobium guangzhouense TaxID=1850347 RepID=UPI0011AF4092|nr:DUF4145 domain-containing protein [Novosphingobium guangzhouense]
MPTLTHDCPRCSTKKITFDVIGRNFIGTDNDWQDKYEVPAVCRHCKSATVFVIFLINHFSRSKYKENTAWVSSANLNDHFFIMDYVSVKDNSTICAPDHVPDDVAVIFREGATCLSLACYNAAGAMFRLVLDMTTKSLLPSTDQEGGPNRAQRTRLYDRLAWLFETGRLPAPLREIADCVREDGNDAAHDGSLAKIDAEDLLDFSRVLLERVYTEPQRLIEARARREDRRRD